MLTAAGQAELELIQGDITQLPVDAMVNAANSSLVGGGGVDGAIHRVGGSQIMRELDQIRARIGTCPPGQAVATSAGLLPAKFVFHAVGPIFRDGNSQEPEQLASCYRVCLAMAAERSLTTISFPSISTGAYGYPVLLAARIAIATALAWLARNQTSIQRVKLVQFDLRDHRSYSQVLRELQSSGVGATSG
jgi:O-acetyl-ADP-ribose deacetylase (regulator of RNase III)